MSPGTVLYVGNFELPDRNAAANRVISNGKIFRALGYRAAFLGTSREERFSGVRRLDAEGFDLWERAYPMSNADWIRQLYDVSDVLAVAEAYGDLKLIVAYNLPYATFKALKRGFKNSAARVCFDCTEWNGYAEGSLPKRLYKKRDERLIRTKLDKICRDIIVISSTMEKKYAGANLLRLPPLVDTEDPIWRQERTPHPGVFEFCFAGTVSDKERLDRAVEAFCGIGGESLRLRIVGLTADDFTAAFPETAGIALADRRVVFEGYLPHRDAVLRALSCDCYVFIREATGRNSAGFPTKFAEAFTCGAPVITTAVSDVAGYVVSADEGEILADASVGEIRGAMERAAGRPSRSRALRRAFDYRNYVDGTEEWIDRIAF